MRRVTPEFRFPFYKFCVAINQHVAHVFAFADRAEFQAGRKFRGQILQAVHGEVRLLIEQGDFEFKRP